MVPALVILVLAILAGASLSLAWGRRDRAASQAAPDLRGTGVFLHRGHTWARYRAEGGVLVGIDDFARRVVGLVDSVELPPPGTSISRGKPAFAVARGNRRVEFVSPVSGLVASVNEVAARTPAALGSDPFDHGWLLDVRPDAPGADFAALIPPAKAAEWQAAEAARLADFVASNRPTGADVGVTLPDGGTAVEGVMCMLDEASMPLLVSKFFR